jgi:predicted RNA-binding Zn-ribbon protein involved in translation (DUF1610 family)
MRGRLAGYQRLRLTYLLDMLYKPSELACELGVSVRQFYRVYIPLGCPVVREKNRVFIHGQSFASWYFSIYPALTMQDHEGYCLTCKKPVSMSDQVLKKSGRLSYYVFNCPNCGRKISRIKEMSKNG